MADADTTAEALINGAGVSGTGVAQPPALPHEPRIHTKTNPHSIHVSTAVLDAAAKDCEELFRSLRTSPAGLTQTEAEQRARTTGPIEVAQERRQGWFGRLLKMLRNPLVVLLVTLATVSFVTGDVRAGSVMEAWWCSALRSGSCRRPGQMRPPQSSRP